MPAASTDTIAAIATPPGRGAVGIIRLSGPRASAIAAAVAGPLPAPRHAALRRFRDAQGQVLDEGLLLWFPGPHSYTGEDVAELQGHGGPVVLDLVLRACLALGARAARAGEFSERAFLNDRIDLAQAEAVADLIDAQTASAARAAQRSLQGEFSARVQALAQRLMALRVHVEGALDFSDEDVDWLEEGHWQARLHEAITDLRQLLPVAGQGRRLREGLVIALAGQPNVGKSTLLNRLAGTEAAIVTEIAGTTRDLLREDIAIDGIPVTVVDTAGLRDSEDPVEREGIRRAWAALEHAELILFLVDDREGVTATDESLLERLPCGPAVIEVHNKCDLSGRAPGHEAQGSRARLRIAAGPGLGLDLLRAEIRRSAGLAEPSSSQFSARARHVAALQRCLAHLADAGRRLQERRSAELAAEDLRLAQRALGELTGTVTSEDLLGEIFARFCIGK